MPDDVLTALALIRPGTRIVSICTGAFVLAAAGLLDGRRATTHWQVADRFRRMFPLVDLDPDVLFVDDHPFLTSAGAASGVDVCLHLVRKDHGSRLANTVARRCVVPPFRDGGQAQYIEQPVPEQGAASTAATRAWILERLGEPLTLADLAGHARMSQRTFARRFHDEVGLSPGRWLIQQRVARARHLLESSDLTVDQIMRPRGLRDGRVPAPAPPSGDRGVPAGVPPHLPDRTLTSRGLVRGQLPKPAKVFVDLLPSVEA